MALNRPWTARTVSLAEVSLLRSRSAPAWQQQAHGQRQNCRGAPGVASCVPALENGRMSCGFTGPAAAAAAAPPLSGAARRTGSISRAAHAVLLGQGC